MDKLIEYTIAAVFAIIAWFTIDLINRLRDDTKEVKADVKAVRVKQAKDHEDIIKLKVQNETLLEKVNNVMAHQASENDVILLLKSEIEKAQKTRTDVKFLMDQQGKILLIIDKIVHKK